MKRCVLVVVLSLLLLKQTSAQSVPWAGGPIVQSPRVILIYWGKPDSTLKNSLDRFYSQIVGSSYLARLWEYGTGPVSTSVPSHFRVWFGYPSEQVIGTGTFAGSFVIQSNASGNVETTDIGPQLDHEIHVGHIPAPDRNTIYMVHFSKAMKVWLGTNLIGIPVGETAGTAFCGYHAAYYSESTSRAIVFGAVPNQGVLPACLGNVDATSAETFTGSHELIEATTDPGSDLITGAFLGVALATDEQAWRIWHGFSGTDPIEIADLCEDRPDRGITLRTSPAAADAYYVARSWSNRMSACVGSGPVGSLDGIQTDGLGAAHVYGWTLDPNAPAQAIQAHLYFDGPYPWGRGYAVVANTPRGDVNSGTGYGGNHGFDFVVPQELRDGRTHAVYAYGIGTTSGNNEFLGGVPLTFNSSLPTQSATTPVMIASTKDPSKCMDVTGGAAVPGTPLQLYSCFGSDNQRFSYHLDTRELRAFNNSSLCLDVSGINIGRTRVIVWSCNGSATQKWSFNLNNGEIRGAGGSCIQTAGESTSNGAAIQLSTCDAGQTQAWFRK